ncbi:MULTISPECIES: hypothetical protein [Streptomyces]|nr:MULTISPECIES: hypothetical protein [Streptomyces]MBT3077608.1 hypothetical protein [Streptomyces sp. COG21]MBT3084454.1 hypothetical protein [Streptomyces sp. COG20]MBT3085361.1 hypothetical protein [Streptomyces sp. CYG21]MBT3095919.1 hypothetical protein [Streptomyces sp. CBG30]MBT3103596.1 hypothetical protein [Streptomyces sp. COG19]
MYGPNDEKQIGDLTRIYAKAAAAAHDRGDEENATALTNITTDLMKNRDE